MFGVLLISRVCFSLSCAAFGSVWSGVDSPLLSHPLLSLPQPFDYVRNAAPPPHVLFYSFAAAPGFAAQRGVAQIFQIFLPFPAVQISAAAADYDAPRLRSVSGVCETAEVDFPISGFAFCKFLSVALKVKLLLRCRVM